MTDLMNLLYDYAQNRRVAGFIDCQAYSQLERMEERSLAALKKGLSSEQTAALERYQDACQELCLMDQEAMFQAGFSIAREPFV